MPDKTKTTLPIDGWGAHRCDEEDKQGRRVQMPEWVMDHACRHVDASMATAIVEVAPDEWVACDAYTAEPLWNCEPGAIEDARQDADRLNVEHGVVPLVIPSSWAVLGVKS
jgi:hypothetical protein